MFTTHCIGVISKASRYVNVTIQMIWNIRLICSPVVDISLLSFYVNTTINWLYIKLKLSFVFVGHFVGTPVQFDVCSMN